MQIKQIISKLENIFPIQYAEDFDNVGLLIGDKNAISQKALITLDVTEKVVDEAISNDCNLIISYHPILFNPIKKITKDNHLQALYIKLIKNDISIYSVHTALDNSFVSSHYHLCDMFELKNIEKLITKKNVIKKLSTYVPLDYADALRKSLFDAGAGNIGNYSNCSFNFKGEGTYLPQEGS